MDISIICPVYNGESYIENLYKNIKKQEKVNVLEVKFILTESKDSSEDILKKLNVEYIKIKSKDFSHSLVREKAAFEAKGEILVFITQDIKIENQNWLYELVKSIENKKCSAAFSRQIAYDNHTIEKYTREINYPAESRIVSKDDIKELGLMTFFFSDASSAILKDIFLELNGYDGKNLPTNEDMYFAYKLIMNGCKISYEAESIVVHSHELSFKDTFKRYRDIGKFFKENSYINKYSVNERGLDVFMYIIKRIKEENRLYFLPKVFMNFIARFIGMKIGKL
ncbi:glycosyltransferase [Clostridium nigeriense]|uniref:glycosyltransferase n=1 Tax=Clostridium nigeriense TaxID=1805470 RepID=UPI00082CCA22|nr:glycosyltransferase [Clostridium nigeriense]